MDAQKYQDALNFMYMESGKPKWWVCRALTKTHNTAGNPPNDLSLAEAESIFHELKKKELLIPFINEHGAACYLLNECKEDEWRSEIANAVKPWFLKSKFLKCSAKIVLWISLAYASGYLGALGENRANESSDSVGVVSP